MYFNCFGKIDKQQQKTKNVMEHMGFEPGSSAQHLATKEIALANHPTLITRRSKRIDKRIVAFKVAPETMLLGSERLLWQTPNQVLPHGAGTQTVRRFNLRTSNRIRPAIPKLWFLCLTHHPYQGIYQM
jgi:hypothetical protein